MTVFNSFTLLLFVEIVRFSWEHFIPSHPENLQSACSYYLLGFNSYWDYVLLCRIIEPLTSRCSKFRFKPLANQVQQERLEEICEKENLKYSKEVHTKISYERDSFAYGPYNDWCLNAWSLVCVCLSLPQGIDALVKVSEGDLRKAITLLQSTARLSAEKEITESIVIEIAGVSLHVAPHLCYLLIK